MQDALPAAPREPTAAAAMIRSDRRQGQRQGIASHVSPRFVTTKGRLHELSAGRHLDPRAWAAAAARRGAGRLPRGRADRRAGRQDGEGCHTLPPGKGAPRLARHGAPPAARPDAGGSALASSLLRDRPRRAWSRTHMAAS